MAADGNLAGAGISLFCCSGNPDIIPDEPSRERAVAYCPDPEVVTAYVVGTLSPAERHRVVSHLAVCPTCAEEVRALGDFQAEVAALPETHYAPGTLPAA